MKIYMFPLTLFLLVGVGIRSAQVHAEDNKTYDQLEKQYYAAQDAYEKSQKPIEQKIFNKAIQDAVKYVNTINGPAEDVTMAIGFTAMTVDSRATTFGTFEFNTRDARCKVKFTGEDFSATKFPVINIQVYATNCRLRTTGEYTTIALEQWTIDVTPDGQLASEFLASRGYDIKWCASRAYLRANGNSYADRYKPVPNCDRKFLNWKGHKRPKILDAMGIP